MGLRTLSAILALSAVTVTDVGGQSRARPYFDVTVGGSLLVGSAPSNGQYYERNGGLALLAFGYQPDVNRSLQAALQVGQLAFTGGDAQCDITPLGGCYQDFPLGAILAITIGGRPLTSSWRFAELTAGPALVIPYQGRTSLGLLTVGRIGLPPGFYLSPGVAFHGIVTPIHGTVMFVAGLGFSLRTW